MEIFTSEGVKLNPNATSQCELCLNYFKIKDMYKAGRICEDCRDEYEEQ